MDKRFFKYLKDRKDIARIGVVVALGLVLIFLGGRGEKTGTESDIGIEERIAEACSAVEGVGDCAVYVYYSAGETRGADDEVESVMVICEGADSVDVRLKLTKLLSSFFGIGSNRVRIEKMKE